MNSFLLSVKKQKFVLLVILLVVIFSLYALAASNLNNNIIYTGVMYTNVTPNTVQTVWGFNGDSNNNAIAVVFFKLHSSPTWTGPFPTNRVGGTFVFTTPELLGSQYYDIRLEITDPDGGSRMCYTRVKTGVATYNSTFWNESHRMSFYSQDTTNVSFALPYFADQNDSLVASAIWIRGSNQTTMSVPVTKTVSAGQKYLIATIPVNQSNIGTGTIVIDNWDDADGIGPISIPPTGTVHSLVASGSLIPSAPVVTSTSREIFMTLPFRGDINGNASISYRYRLVGDEFGNWNEMHRTGESFNGTIVNIVPNREYQIEFGLVDPEGTLVESFVVSTLTKRITGANNKARINLQSQEVTVNVANSYYWWVGRPLQIRIAPDAIGRSDVYSVDYTWSIVFDRFISKRGSERAETIFTNTNIVDYLNVESPVIGDVGGAGPFSSDSLLEIEFLRYGAYRYIITYDVNIVYTDLTTENIVFSQENIVYTVKGNLAVQ